jgi:hypothetical protein
LRPILSHAAKPIVDRLLLAVKSFEKANVANAALKLAENGGKVRASL